MTRKTARTLRSRDAFLMADAVMGIVVVAVLSVSLIAVLGKRRQAAQQLSDLREATRAAEAALTDLQAARPPPAPGSGKVVRPLGPSATPRRTWVEVEATVGNQRVTLAGLVPGGAAMQPAATQPSAGEAP